MTSVPLNPPWDQGDKNLAYTLVRSLGEHRFHALGIADGLPPEGDNLQLYPLYRSRNPSLLQKTQVYWRLLDRSFSNGQSFMGNLKPDLYHLIYRPTPVSSLVNRLLPEFKKRPTLHTIPAISSVNGGLSSLFFADRLVTISDHGYQVLLELGFDNVTCIPPGIDVDDWARLPAQRAQLKADLGLGGGPAVLYPGHYSPGYGVDVILNALPAMVAQNPGVQVLFACRLRSKNDQERELAVQQQIDRLGLEQNVRFFNTVTDMRLLIGASDLTLLPLETMRDKVDIPISLLESLAAGVPIVVTDLAPMNELLSPAQTGGDPPGLCIPCGDAQALAGSVTRLLHDPGLRNRLAANGQALVRERYHARRMAAQYDKIYKEISC